MQSYNKYYSPDYDGTSNINVLAGKSTKGKMPIVRFALPFDVYCTSCNKQLARGNRYNAEKVKHGDYLGIVVWKFKSKCHLCSSPFEIETDPQNSTYKVVSGLRRTEADLKAEGEKNERAASETSNGNPLALLEKSVEKSRAIKRDELELNMLYEKNERQWADTYGKSQELRKHHRNLRSASASIEENKKLVQKKHSLSIPLVEFTTKDTVDAKLQFAESEAPLAKSDPLKSKIKSSLDPFSGPSREGVVKRRKSKREKNTVRKPLIDYTD